MNQRFFSESFMRLFSTHELNELINRLSLSFFNPYIFVTCIFVQTMSSVD